MVASAPVRPKPCEPVSVSVDAVVAGLPSTFAVGQMVTANRLAEGKPANVVVPPVLPRLLGGLCPEASVSAS